MINYIVCFYFKWESYKRKRLLANKFQDVAFHLNAMENLHIPDIGMCTFIVNKTSEIEYGEVELFIKNNYKGHIPIEVKYRENKGLSYGAWEFQIREVLGKYDYYFLIEDDYYPVVDRFYDPFIYKFEKNTGYVCMIYSDGHPKFSNGVISNECCEDVLEKFGEIFINYNDIINNKLTYYDGCLNVSCDNNIELWQGCFHINMLNGGWNIKSIEDEYLIVFRHNEGAMIINDFHYLKNNIPILLPTH